VEEEDEDEFDAEKAIEAMAARDAGVATAVAGPSAAADETIVLKAQCKHGLVRVGLRSSDPFRVFIDKFARHAVDKGWLRPGQGVRLQLDGDEVAADDTPETHDLEGDEVIDVLIDS